MILEFLGSTVGMLSEVLEVSDVVILGMLADIVLGWVPDRFSEHKGLILKIATRMYNNGKVIKDQR
jgi:hypothetical protein